MSINAARGDIIVCWPMILFGDVWELAKQLILVPAVLTPVFESSDKQNIALVRHPANSNAAIEEEGSNRSELTSSTKSMEC